MSIHISSKVSHFEKVVSEYEDAGKEVVEGDPEFLEKGIHALADDKVGEDWLADKSLGKRLFYQWRRFFIAFSALYFFLVSLSLMGDSFSALTGKSAGTLFSGDQNPVVGLMVGLIATALVQSSSTTTSIIVVLVGQDLIDVQTAVPMVMGANIGTSVTSTLVSLGFANDAEKYERGFAGGTVHDMFNYLNVFLLLPLELLVSALRGGDGGMLQFLAEELAGARGDGELKGGEEFEDANPIKKITNPILDFILQISKDVISDYAQGFPSAPPPEAQQDCELSFTFNDESTAADEFGCKDFVCDFCPEGVFNQTLYDQAKNAFDSERLVTGGLFESWGDTAAAIVCLILSLVLLMGSLGVMVKMMSLLVKGKAEQMLIKSLNHNYKGGDYVSILIGCAVTFVVQSSSITTSLLTPLVAVGALSIENMFPYTLGANIGTTGTGLIAAAAEGETTGYTIALVHFFFNVIGTLIWFPWKKIRNIPLSAAKTLGRWAAMEKSVPVIYIVMAFLVYPAICLGLSEGFSSGNGGGITVAILFLLILVGIHVYVLYWIKYKDGRDKFIAFMQNWRNKRNKNKKKSGDELSESPLQHQTL